jgi:hypothetical protein
MNNAYELVTEVDAQAFFQDAVQSALSHQHLKAQHETVIYISNLLHLALHTEQVFENDGGRRGHKPLAMIYGEALEAPSISHRDHSLKKLGDVALFVSGVFANSLNRSLVDVNYYIKMGGNAYGVLADSRLVCRQTDAFKSIYAELAGQFSAFVDVLSEVSESAYVDSGSDITRLYETWQRTGSQWSLKKLRSLGIEPINMHVTQH